MTTQITLPRNKKIEIARAAAGWFFASNSTNLHGQVEAVTSAAINLTMEAMQEAYRDSLVAGVVLPAPICRDDTEHGKDYYTADQLKQAIADALAKQDPFKALPDEEVLFIAESHGIDTNTCDCIGFYTDLIQTTPCQDQKDAA